MATSRRRLTCGKVRRACLADFLFAECEAGQGRQGIYHSVLSPY